jgi:hypothetical protein
MDMTRAINAEWKSGLNELAKNTYATLPSTVTRASGRRRVTPCGSDFGDKGTSLKYEYRDQDQCSRVP